MKQIKFNLSEKEFQSHIEELARLNGWKYYHTWNSLHSPSGFPDLVMVRDKRQIFAELKSEKGKLTEYQLEWLKALQEVPSNEVFVWRPSNWEEIVKVLER
ncbi:MAG: VRR-NUC domain-containing protein [Dehalococcoidales bacterium]|nr:VRR-NUC domain-containing protein [Dehalococcoidales bacterium]